MDPLIALMLGAALLPLTLRLLAAFADRIESKLAGKDWWERNRT